MIRTTAAMMLFAIALPATAQTSSDPTPGAPALTAKPDKKICRRIEQTGSIMAGKSVCHSKSEWAAIDAANGDSAAAARDTRGVAGNSRGL